MNLRVFFSYKRRDEAKGKIEAFDRGLRAAGIEVLRDVDLVGVTNSNFVRTLDEAVVACDIGIVLWTKRAAKSDAIAGEATKLAYMNKLVNVVLEDAEHAVPAHFFAAQRFDFEAWDGDSDAPMFRDFVDALNLRADINRQKSAQKKTANVVAVLPAPAKPGELIRSFADLPMLVAAHTPATFRIGPSANGQEVRIERDYMIGKRPITFADWNYAAQSGAPGVDVRAAPDEEESYPVVGVSWRDAQNYIAWLNFRTQGLWRYRLLSEAEWECCAKLSQPRVLLSEPQYSPAGAVTESDWGVFDLPGWIWEWTEDFFVESTSAGTVDGLPREQPISDFRTVRGRTWRERGLEDGITSRTGLHENYAADDVGFRIMRATG